MKRLPHYLCGLLLSTFATTALSVSVDISQIPLYIGGQTKPNIMFILDDSGSMHWEILPDDLIYSYYMYPRVSNVYGSSDYTNYVPLFGDTNTNGNPNTYGMALRSSKINPSYYDPSITYEPWSKYDGSSYPDASPSCAYHNPEKTTLGCRDLTTDNTETASWDSCTDGIGITCTYEPGVSKTFWPAVYYTYSGADTVLSGAEVWDDTNYTEVLIKDPADGGSATYTGSTARSDCAAAPSCTYAEEIQNFANWYTYYRSRILTARAGAGRAFSQLIEPTIASAAPRVGFGMINKGATTIDGTTNTKTIVTGVRPFVTTDRQAFFTNLYTKDIPIANTPLRRALDDAGKYFSRGDDKGPWNETPGVAGGDEISCRQNYTIMTTDGYWNSDAASTTAATNNNDGTSATSAITGPDGKSYTYSAVSPFSDSYSNTLADVGMYYWKNDLRGGATGLTNNVPTNVLDPAFWQHMVTFGVSLGLNGTIDPVDAFAAIDDSSTTITWPDPAATNEAKLDDLLHAAVNSRGYFASAQNPKEFADGLTSAINNVTGRTSSASAIATNSTRLDANTFIYQAKYDSSDWSGRLLAYKINTDGSVGAQQWDAAINMPSHASRKIYTLDGTTGVEFKWATLSATQKTALGSENMLNYIRGDSSNEVRFGGTYRNRNLILGDIINSDPWYVGEADYGYSVLDDVEGNTYIDFLSSTAYKNRRKVVYVGANDGMLHAFDGLTGDELFSYVPNEIINTLPNLASTTYSHQFYVDGSPRAGDAYIDVGSGDQWRTVLVGSTGAGGKSVFALDVTDPDTFTTSDIMWEFTNSELGYTIGQANIVRLSTGQWGAVFGNGYNSTSQTARIFIVDVETGNLIKEIDTGVGDSTDPNGMATPIVVDVEGDRIADYIYAGDLHGNLWRFDITDTLTSKWASPYKSGNKPAPLFVAQGPSSERQPITAKPQVGSSDTGGLMIYFGTGKYFEVGDNIVPTTPDIMSFYGILDDGSTVTRSELLAQQIFYEDSQSFTHPETGETFNYDVRAVTQNPAGSEPGWYIDLTSPPPANHGAEGERVVSAPLLWTDRVIFTTLIPNIDPCMWGGTSWLMEVDPMTGGRLNYSVFDLNHDNAFNSDEYITVTDSTGDTIKIPVSGKKSKEGIIKTPGVVCADAACYKYSSGSSGDVEVSANKGTMTSGRQSWQQLR